MVITPVNDPPEAIDIDGNEIYLLNKLTQIRPRVIIVEYNSKFPPPIKKTIKYSPNFSWKYDDYSGSSLQLLTDNLNKKKYSLVGCNISGMNAFFIRNEGLYFRSSINFLKEPTSLLVE